MDGTEPPDTQGLKRQRPLPSKDDEPMPPAKRRRFCTFDVRELCDCEIVLSRPDGLELDEDRPYRRFYVSRALLGQASTFFATLFTGVYADSSSPTVSIKIDHPFRLFHNLVRLCLSPSPRPCP